MYNTILSSAQHHGKAGVAAEAMQMMMEKGVPRDAQTWVLIFRALVSPLLQKCLEACYGKRYLAIGFT